MFHRGALCPVAATIGIEMGEETNTAEEDEATEMVATVEDPMVAAEATTDDQWTR